MDVNYKIIKMVCSMTEIKNVCLELGIPLDRIFVHMIESAIYSSFERESDPLSARLNPESFIESVNVPIKFAYMINDLKEDMDESMKVVKSFSQSNSVSDRMKELINKLREGDYDV